MFCVSLKSILRICLFFSGSYLKGILLEDMSLEEKVGQVLMVHFNGEYANEDAKKLIQGMYVGGFIYFNPSNGLHSPAQVNQLSRGLQELARKNRLSLPLFIAIDQEGGLVARLQQGFTQFPGNKAIGMAGDPDLARKAACAMGQEMRAVGINMNFAPVVDVNTNPYNPVIGIRAFADNPEEVITFGKNALDGYRQAGTIATLKHFPGHGDTVVDSHQDLPKILKSLHELETIELSPFAHLAESVDAIMTAHLIAPALDADHCSTISKKTLAYLREKIGFKGVIVTDSLIMQGILNQTTTVGEAAIQALDAGCDIILVGGVRCINGTTVELSVDDVKEIRNSLLDSIRTGRVSESRLNEAVQRILNLKKLYLDFSYDTATPINTTENYRIAEEIAQKAVRVHGDLSQIKNISCKKIFICAPEELQNTLNKTNFLFQEPACSVFFENLNPSELEITAAQCAAKNADLILFFSYNAWKNPLQKALIQWLLDLEKPMVIISTADPVDLSLFPKANNSITTFSPTEPSIKAACTLLKMCRT